MRYRSEKYKPYQRPVESKKEDPIFKYFIIFEGEKTESSYLLALRGVSKKHPFVMVEKVGNEKGFTLLNQMIALADDMLKKDNANKCTYQRAYSNIAKEFQSKGLKPLTEHELMKKSHLFIKIHLRTFHLEMKSKRINLSRFLKN